MKELVIALAVIGGYLLAGGATYGYAYHQHECNPDRQYNWCNYDKQSAGAYAAVFWPVYWPGHIARKALAP